MEDNNIHTIKLQSCIGCAPQYIHYYELVSMSPGVRLVGRFVQEPPPGTVGGTKTYVFQFQLSGLEESTVPRVVFKQTNALGEYVANRTYTLVKQT